MFYATGLPGWMRFGGYAAPYGNPAPYQKPDPEIKKRLGEIETRTTAE
jgi:hypothetical protein